MEEAGGSRKASTRDDCVENLELMLIQPPQWTNNGNFPCPNALAVTDRRRSRLGAYLRGILVEKLVRGLH